MIDIAYERFIGGSGGVADRLGDLVIKSTNIATDQARWFSIARDVCLVPRVERCRGNTITMEYVPGELLNEVCTIGHLAQLFALTAGTFSNMPSLDRTPWSVMVDKLRGRIRDHEVSEGPAILKMIDSSRMHKIMNHERSFCHGDLTLENIIVSPRGLCLIDPYLPYGLYSSWLLDVGKLYFSLHHRWEERIVLRPARIHKKPLFCWLHRRLAPIHHIVLLLELTHYVRALPYRKLEWERALMKKTIGDIWREICFSIVSR